MIYNTTHDKNSEDEGYLSLIKGVLWGTCDKKPLQYVTLHLITHKLSRTNRHLQLLTLSNPYINQSEQVYNTVESPLWHLNRHQHQRALLQHISACAVIISGRCGACRLDTAAQAVRGVLSDFCQCVAKSPGHLDYKL